MLKHLSWVTVLVIYFSVIILGCLVLTAIIWKPAPQLLPLTVIEGPMEKTIKVENSSVTERFENGSRTVNTTSFLNEGKGNTTTYSVTVKTTLVPTTLEREKALLALALLMGAVGSSVHSVTSLVIWQSKNKLQREFASWYVTRPLIGASLAVAVYFLLRSTLLTTVSAPQLGGASFINEYGVAGISVLVGLMTAQMTQKLRDVFDSMFGIQKGTDKGDIDIVEENTLSLIPKNLQVNKNQSVVLLAVVKNNVNNPIPEIGVEFSVVDSNVVIPIENTIKKTDSNGMAVFAVRGNEIGKTKIHASVELEKKTVYDNVLVQVIDTQVTTPPSTPQSTPIQKKES